MERNRGHLGELGTVETAKDFNRLKSFVTTFGLPQDLAFQLPELWLDHVLDVRDSSS